MSDSPTTPTAPIDLDVADPDLVAAASPAPADIRPSVGRRFFRQKVVWFAGSVLLLLVTVAIFAPWIAPYDPNATVFSDAFARPSSAHWLGADQFGRDTLSRLIFGGRVAAISGLEAVGVAALIGIPIGLIVGYVGGWPDRIAMRIVDALMSLPGLVVALSILAVLGPGLVNAMLAVGILFSVRLIRLLRGTVISVREELYIDAAKLSGVPTPRILMRHVLPNAAGPLLVQLALYFGAALLIEAMLSFLGVGVELPNATWGNMLAEARGKESNSPFLPIPPGVAITLTVLSFNLVADALRDALVGTATTPLVKRSKSSRPSAGTAATSDSPATASTGSTASTDAVLSVNDLTVSFGNPDTPTLRGVNLDVRQGETLGLVGESGSGKSLTALGVMGLLPPTADVTNGSVTFEGTDLMHAPQADLLKLRGDQIAMIFQDPMTALNPSMPVGRQIGEVLEIHRGVSKSKGMQAAAELLDQVGVPHAQDRVRDFPHQFSGGMAQRVMISMALAANPKLLIADEPTTALDVTTQAQVLDLLLDLQQQLGLSILFITHDMGVVADVCDRVAVMYAGLVVETGDVTAVFESPAHPYTAALLAATPDDTQAGGRWPTIPGRVPRPDQLGAGCAFADRCAHVIDVCRTEAPPTKTIAAGHTARCFLADRLVDTERIDAERTITEKIAAEEQR